VCVCVNENLTALVRSRELRLRGERTRRDENARERIKCPVNGERVTALVARLNVVGRRENTAGPQVEYLSDCSPGSVYVERWTRGTRAEEEGGKRLSLLACLSTRRRAALYNKFYLRQSNLLGTNCNARGARGIVGANRHVTRRREAG
jgi:hypothetical protein